MIVLAIHTAGPACDLALLKDDAIVAELREEMMRGQDSRLPGLVQDLLTQTGISLADIDRFAVVTGPGSFTGIRVGVAFARGLALAMEKPCLGVTLLEAALPTGQQGSALVAIPAQKRPPDITFWTQTFRTGVATNIASEMRLEDMIAFLNDRPHMLYGDASALSAHFPQQAHEAIPRAALAARVAALGDPNERSARPTYVRAPDAALPQPKSKK